MRILVAILPLVLIVSVTAAFAASPKAGTTAGTPTARVNANASDATTYLIKWDGQHFRTAGALRSHVIKRGGNWSVFLAKHPAVVRLTRLPSITWNGKRFFDQASLKGEFARMNASYRKWAKNHPAAAATLAGTTSKSSPASPTTPAPTPAPAPVQTAPVTATPVAATTPLPAPAPVTPLSTTTSGWKLTDPRQPSTTITNPSGLGLFVNNKSGGSYTDYVIDGGGDSSVLLQGTTNNVTLSRIHITRTKANPTVSWAAHGMYVKAASNSFSDIYADNAGGQGVSGISVRMRGNTFERTVVKGYVHAVTYYEHDGAGATTTFRNGDWTFTGDTAVWGDDSNEPPTPTIKQSFVFENIDAHGPSGAMFLKFRSSSYNGAGVTIRNCTINGRPVTAAQIAGVPASLLSVS